MTQKTKSCSEFLTDTGCLELKLSETVNYWEVTTWKADCCKLRFVKLGL